MKNTIKLSLSVIALLLAFSALSSCTNETVQLNDDLKSTQSATSSGNINSDCTCIDNWPTTISPEETALVLHMREEEKLARDVYAYFYTQFNLRVFNNISNSEQKHMSSVLCILNQYGIEDPVIDEEGVFSDSDLQELYNALTEQGSASLTDALVVGATIEDLDIYDLDEALNVVENSAIQIIFNNLRCGSYNHMRAFIRQLNRQNNTYTPQYISTEDFEAILAGELGDCSNMGSGSGNGNGNGNGQGYRQGNGYGHGNGKGYKTNRTGNLKRSARQRTNNY